MTRQILGFMSFETADREISGIKTMHMIHKGKIEESRDAVSEVRFISEIMADAALILKLARVNIVIKYFLHQNQ